MNNNMISFLECSYLCFDFTILQERNYLPLSWKSCWTWMYPETGQEVKYSGPVRYSLDISVRNDRWGDRHPRVKTAGQQAVDVAS